MYKKKGSRLNLNVKKTFVAYIEVFQVKICEQKYVFATILATITPFASCKTFDI